ncbi:molybdenum cofactor guanylyltransferase [Tissierella creatinini]|nr:molybdenum cofactor guanylyltransferase [Tissierella creatinini]TJX66142.1 molybdenum cofactor guanylyltransferase [Soehngenia saccharolytica]
MDRKFGTAIILAGGKSSRMGFDKQLLNINEARLIDDVISKLKVQFDEIIIVTNKPELYIGSPHIITSDIFKDMGPLGGIHAGLKLSSSQYAFVVACDMPNINMEYMNFMKDKLMLAGKDSFGIVTRLGIQIEPFHGFYSIQLIDQIEYYLSSGRRSINGLIKDFNMIYIEEDEARKFSPKWDMFMNLNTMEDLSNYLTK